MKHDVTSGASFDAALQLYRAGNREQARSVCARLLAATPREPRAHFLIGTIELDAGNTNAAVTALERAVSLAPNLAPFLCNLGLAYAKAGALEKARETLLRTLVIDPKLVEAAFNLGLVELDRGDVEAALLQLGHAAAERPRSFTIQRSFARALLRAGRADEAIARFRSALALNSSSPETELELVGALQGHGRKAEAAELAEQVVHRHPNLWEAHYRRGQVLSKQDKLDEAAACFERAVELAPQASTAQRELGLALIKLGCLEEALVALERTVQLDPEAEGAHSRFVYYSAFSPRYGAERVFEIARRFGDLHARSPSERPSYENDRSAERRLRVGYVSPEFRDHVQRLFTLPVFESHDHGRYEIICYSSTSPNDAWTARLRAHADAWHEVGHLSHAELADRIRGDRIDVLVDLNMHMSGQRLKTFARMPAPVQIAWLAYPGTTGITGMDYRITDPHLDPPGAPLPYSERSLHLPDCFWCYDPKTEEPPANELPALAAGHVTFGSLNNFLKVNTAVLETWARVLRAVPDSRLLLLAPSNRARDLAARTLEAQGVSEQRLDFVGLMWRKDYLATYHRIDVALDCFPYNGHTTSLDAFFMGVPVVSLVGSTVVGRAGLCQAAQLGLTELVAEDADGFVAAAVELARDWPRLQALRRDLRGRLRESPLCDAPRFTRNLEAAYREAWRRFCAEEPDANVSSSASR